MKNHKGSFAELHSKTDSFVYLNVTQLQAVKVGSGHVTSSALVSLMDTKIPRVHFMCICLKVATYEKLKLSGEESSKGTDQSVRVGIYCKYHKLTGRVNFYFTQ